MQKFKYKLSILVLAYNHEKYIQKALDSIVMQQKSFSYEVLIGEDSSTDKTKEILNNYKNDSLDNFHIYYRESNIGSLNNILDLFQRAEGEYLVVLEGDDFWISSEKLQRQVDFLDNNMEYIAVSHRCVLVDEDSKPLPYPYSAECYHKEYTLKDFRMGVLPGQTTTIMYRNIYKDKNIHTDLSCVTGYPGDRRIAFLLASNGKIRCWDQKFSAYRHVVLKGESHSATIKEDRNYYKAQLDFFQSIYDYAKKNFETTEIHRISSQCYMKILFRDQFRKTPLLPRNSFTKEFRASTYKLSICLWIVFSIILYPIERIGYHYYLFRAKRIELKRK